MREYEYTKGIHDRLYKVRTELGMSQEQMSLAMGYSHGYFSTLESRKSVRVNKNVVVAFCSQFGISYDYLVFGEGDMFVDKERKRALLDKYEGLCDAYQITLLKFAQYLANENPSLDP